VRPGSFKKPVIPSRSGSGWFPASQKGLGLLLGFLRIPLFFQGHGGFLFGFSVALAFFRHGFISWQFPGFGQFTGCSASAVGRGANGGICCSAPYGAGDSWRCFLESSEVANGDSVCVRHLASSDPLNRRVVAPIRVLSSLAFGPVKIIISIDSAMDMRNKSVEILTYKYLV